MVDKSKVPMPNRERFLAVCRGKRLGDVPIADWYNKYWAETPAVWVKQGAPKEILTAEGFQSYFQLDHYQSLQEIVACVMRSDLKEDPEQPGSGYYLVTPPVVPVFEQKVLREDGRHRVETTYGGATVEVSKEHPLAMPRYLDHPVKDWASWREYKKRLDPDTPERWPRDWEAYVARRNSQDAPTLLMLAGFFGMLREWAGLERLLFMFYDEPDLVEDMMEQMLYLVMGVAKRALRDLRVECVRFWEDMAYKAGPLISPAMVRKFMLPHYRKITDFLHSQGIDIIHLDSDGNVNELIPIWLEVGINFPWPLEVAAGMDGVALRKKYGKDIILGGNIDKRAFIKGKDVLREEVMSKVPYLVETGAFFPGIDHSTPPDVPFENFCYFINLLREIGGLEKLPE
ncbi:MAG: uroporphyrinogen decarboxylase family protein [Dehalococcoidales bacterium]|nr:uroporphyrinogen decarboxylase family protein [Dehalococcoidales bacterium]